MCEFFFGCDYCVLLTINMLQHVEVMCNQLLNLYFNNFNYFSNFRPFTCFSVMIPETV